MRGSAGFGGYAGSALQKLLAWSADIGGQPDHPWFSGLAAQLVSLFRHPAKYRAVDQQGRVRYRLEAAEGGVSRVFPRHSGSARSWSRSTWYLGEADADPLAEREGEGGAVAVELAMRLAAARPGPRRRPEAILPATGPDYLIAG